MCSQCLIADFDGVASDRKIKIVLNARERSRSALGTGRTWASSPVTRWMRKLGSVSHRGQDRASSTMCRAFSLVIEEDTSNGTHIDKCTVIFHLTFLVEGREVCT